MSAHEKMLEVELLNVRYGAIHALRDVSLYVQKGEIVTIVGANGAGKSTLLRTISGLVRASSGTIIFDGEDITHLPTHEIVRRGLVHAPEGRRIFANMTVRENLLLGAYVHNNPDTLVEDFERVFHIFPRLREREHQIAGTLSGGEQQMLAIGRALMSHPKLLMLDEPSWGLHPIWCRRYSVSSAKSTQRALPSCWWNRTPTWHCALPIAATCWRQER